MSLVLIVDDEQAICWGLAELVREMGHEALTAASAEAGLEAARRTPPQAVVLDVRLPGISGLEAMPRFRELLGRVPIVVITAYGELSTAVAAVRNGAFDYLIKPFDLQTAERAISRALASSRTQLETAPPSAAREESLVGVSPAIQEVFKRIALVAVSDACVHLYGESGTGKELAARAIHRHSRRHEGPFVAVNIAALSPTLAESELFGHVRGAFTGADEPRRGLLAQAHGGTIFLDEVGDIPLPIQVKLLRALEQGEVLPVGSNEPIKSDFRVISATHQNLPEMVASGRFRHDLYFRLVTFEIKIPPLRDRREDIRPLAEHFLSLLAHASGGVPPRLPPEALAELERLPWHGNVRELRNAIEHATILARGGVIAAEHLPPPAPSATTAAMICEDALAELVRQWAEAQLASGSASGDLYGRLLGLVEPPLLQASMAHFQGQCATAARRLGLHRTTLRKKLQNYGIE